MKSIFYFLLLQALITNAQNNGVKFVQGLSWEQIKQKAKDENKYIFVDCYASWCAPCEMMNNNIFTSEKVGEYINKKFIAIKVQFDSTKVDNEFVRTWLNNARGWTKEYEINSFPSFLFFSENGELVNREAGYKSIHDFVVLLRDATNPEKQFYSLVEKYKAGEKNYQLMPQLINAAIKMGQKDLAKSIAKDYKLNYLDYLHEDAILTKENLEILTGYYYLVSSKDKFFNMCYRYPEKVDVLLFEGAADRFVNFVIKKEEIVDYLEKDNKITTLKPDWNKIINTISKKYKSTYATSIVPDYQFYFYSHIKNWKAYASLVEKRLKQFPPTATGTLFGGALGDVWTLNSHAWNVFLNCNDKTILKMAVAWSELVLTLRPNANYLDTKANLMYKLGNVEQAIVLEQEALRMEIDYAIKNGRQDANLASEYRNIIVKMKKGEPTWQKK